MRTLIHEMTHWRRPVRGAGALTLTALSLAACGGGGGGGGSDGGVEAVSRVAETIVYVASDNTH